MKAFTPSEFIIGIIIFFCVGVAVGGCMTRVHMEKEISRMRRWESVSFPPIVIEVRDGRTSFKDVSQPCTEAVWVDEDGGTIINEANKVRKHIKKELKE